MEKDYSYYWIHYFNFYFISLVLSNQDANVSSNDNIISTWDSIAMIIFILIIPLSNNKLWEYKK